MDTGDVYLVDLRKEHRSRVELVEVQEEGEEDSSSLIMTATATCAPLREHTVIVN